MFLILQSTDLNHSATLYKSDKHNIQSTQNEPPVCSIIVAQDINVRGKRRNIKLKRCGVQDIFIRM